ncbi:hypothetical protein FRB99_002404 [Tulasnella sp. 403]|nr:hypothetical protein FRB99_002404 [Tulasnella sp. 403]
MDPLVESPTSSPSPTTTSFSNASSKKKKQVRRCRKCLKMIHDGKWVHVDVGTPKAGVMCDWDWKDSYLPKCRRCEKPIEGHVISASDGQMVGKYHRGCFSCVRCNEPFPDKSFYVWDGMPHCKLHYHESNGSLCAAASCGQPIEGPCAVADDGSRYHPEHFVCDWEGGADQPPTRRAKCTNRLEDYWEVGPRKYCSERHAMWAQEVAYQAELKAKQEGRATNDAKGSGSKATKRRTMFIEQVVDKMAL